MSSLSSLYSLYRELSRYRSLEDTVNESIRYLTRAINDSEDAMSIKNYYLIDDAQADNKLIENDRNNLIRQKQFLSGSVLSEIRNKIRQIEREIDDLERERAENS